MTKKRQLDLEDAINKLSVLDVRGHEVPDSVPMAPPVGFIKQPDMFERMREMVRNEMSRAAAAAGAESFEEADDFDVGDDYDPRSPYEAEFEGLSIAELRSRAAEAEAASRKSNAPAAPTDPKPPAEGPVSPAPRQEGVPKAPRVPSEA